MRTRKHTVNAHRPRDELFSLSPIHKLCLPQDTPPLIAEVERVNRTPALVTTHFMGEPIALNAGQVLLGESKHALTLRLSTGPPRYRGHHCSHRYYRLHTFSPKSQLDPGHRGASS